MYLYSFNLEQKEKKGFEECYFQVSFFRFPVDTQQRDRWIAALRREDWLPTQYSRVCSAHFVSGK